MSTTVDAIYENGVLRLSRPIDVADGTPVDVIVIPCSLQPGKRTPAELIPEIAAMPVESSAEGFSGRDHGKILYGDQGASPTAHRRW
jgi:predicted DNA-binding antitoxin AbrB/MazE fold protein